MSKNAVMLLVILFLLIAITAYPQSGKKVYVMGIDGLDPTIMEYLIKLNKLPNIQKLIKTGTYRHLKTSCPPQSPVAWSNFITGGNPGQHGIFDFIHRDPETYLPLLSTSKTNNPEKILKVGNYRIPLSSGSVELFRKGRPFWQYLEDAGIYSTIFKIPSNFPPVEMKYGEAFSGMGTPDLLGTSGTFYLFTDITHAIDEDISGGKVFMVRVDNNSVNTFIEGPPNTFVVSEKDSRGRDVHPELKIPLDIYVDPVEEIIEISVQDHDFLLKKGEFSDWVELEFEVIPYVQSLSAIVKFYLIESKPNFKLYMSPLNINPSNPALPVSSPASFSKRLAREFGYFYTQNMPEDTKAYSNSVFSTEDYIKQADMVFEESIRLHRYFLDNFKEGFLFYYFSTLDQNTHMLWQLADINHPAHNEEFSRKYGFYFDSEESGNIPYFLDYDRHDSFSGHPYLFELYEKIDDEIGYALSHIDENTTFIIVSDHGFAPYYRSVHLNKILYDNGYISLKDESVRGQYPFFRNVDWSATRAYAIGLNGLYINIRGRERNGIVNQGRELKDLVLEIKNLLLEAEDPETGDRMISNVYLTDDEYSGPYKELAPDIIVGYAKGYRASWETCLGKIPEELVRDNTDPWSGDHCMDPAFLSGVFLSNRRFDIEEYSLSTMADLILSEFGLNRTE